MSDPFQIVVGSLRQSYSVSDLFRSTAQAVLDNVRPSDRLTACASDLLTVCPYARLLVCPSDRLATAFTYRVFIVRAISYFQRSYIHKTYT